jgi:hypothetical protein
VEQAQNDSGVVLGTFPVNSVPATVLFDSGASHSFITDQFVTKHNLSMSPMKNPLIVSSPSGEMKTGYICPQVKINIMGVNFLANLVVLKSWGIDIILGMDWLKKHDGVIQCRKKSVLLLTQNLHPAPSTQQAEQSWLNTRTDSKACQSIFLKLTKGNAVRCQSLELAGWYQTVPYLRLKSHIK